MLAKLNRLLGIAEALDVWVHFHFTPIPGGDIQISFSKDPQMVGNGISEAPALEEVIDIALVFAIAEANKSVGRADTKIAGIQTERDALAALLGEDISGENIIVG